MSFTPHSGKQTQSEHRSSEWHEAESRPGVRYRISRISVGKRIELARRIREIGRRAEFLEASNEPREKLEATVISSEIDRAYLEWGLEEIAGLTIDGEAATVAALIDKGPMDLAREILGRIRKECGLSEAERKN